MTDGGTPAVGGVLLAAGEGTRFEDGNKLLSRVEGEPIVAHATQTLCESDLDGVVVVVGHESTAVREAIEEFDVTVVHNENYREGQSTSVEAALESVRERGWDGTVFALGDMPFVRPKTITRLREAYASESGSIVAATYEQKRGNPVLFGRRHYDELERIDGDRGGRRIIEENENTARVETDDPGVTRDIDYKEDLEKYT